MDIYGRFDGDCGFDFGSSYPLTAVEREQEMSYDPMMNERMGPRDYPSGNNLGQNDGYYSYDNINSYRHVQAAYPGQVMQYSQPTQFTPQPPPERASYVDPPKKETLEGGGDSAVKKDRIILLLHIALAFAFLALIALGLRVEYLQTKLNDLTV